MQPHRERGQNTSKSLEVKLNKDVKIISFTLKFVVNATRVAQRSILYTGSPEASIYICKCVYIGAQLSLTELCVLCDSIFTVTGSR